MIQKQHHTIIHALNALLFISLLFVFPGVGITSVSADAIPTTQPDVSAPAADFPIWLPFISIVAPSQPSPTPLPTQPVPTPQPTTTPPPAATSPRVNAPYFATDIRRNMTAPFWFGQVTVLDNYADGRIGYNQEKIYISVTAFDRRLWYDKTPTTSDLADWDAASIYFYTSSNPVNNPDGNSYQFTAQINWWEPRENYQAVYRGNGSEWVPASAPFTTTSEWRGNGFNDDEMDKGWRIIFEIPFSAFGLSGSPANGEMWKIAVRLHDRDDADGTIAIADKDWPVGLNVDHPDTWSELRFGLPTYSHPATSSPTGETILKSSNDLNVIDAHVGGHTTCGDDYGPGYFDGWGDANYSGYTQINIQNQGDVSDWPCFSKYYITFPLDTLPTGSSIISATLQMHMFGNSGQGWDPAPTPSLVQVMTIADPWDENTITWNNAPHALENIAETWVYPVETTPPWPGIPYNWDVSQAVVQAHLNNEPLRLVLYSSDYSIHSGKYFYSSDADEAGRPSLTVVWGNP